MKLKCDAHGRRVAIVSAGVFMHKTGDNTVCSSDKATIGTVTFNKNKWGDPWLPSELSTELMSISHMAGS